MRQERGDLWTYPADARCITVNGTLNRQGELVMGKGVALEAKKRFPLLPKRLANWLEMCGNTPCYMEDLGIISFPTKHHYAVPSDLLLITRSAEDIVAIVDELPKLKTIVMTRPGCGNGKLEWPVVERALAPLLDDRFVVLTLPTPETPK